MVRIVFFPLLVLCTVGTVQAQSCFTFTQTNDGCKFRYPLQADNLCNSNCIPHLFLGWVCPLNKQSQRLYENRSSYDQAVFPAVQSTSTGFQIDYQIVHVCYREKNCKCTHDANGWICSLDEDAQERITAIDEHILNINAPCQNGGNGGGDEEGGPGS